MDGRLGCFHAVEICCRVFKAQSMWNMMRVIGTSREAKKGIHTEDDTSNKKGILFALVDEYKQRVET